jgi:uncharacterized protein HemX
VIAAVQGAPPVPPVPPLPGQELSVSGSLDGWDAVLALLAAAVLVGILLWPLVKAIARRIEAGAAVAEARSELMGLQERVRLLEESQPRVAELEERLDFAERLLAQQREPDRLQP